VITVIVKPTDGCNARCRYCSAAHPGAARRMSEETLAAVFRLFREWTLEAADRRICFIWHGGEPLLMPVSFWEKVLSFEESFFAEVGIEVENRIQTNLTCLTEELIPVLGRLLGKGGGVGTSVEPLSGIRELAGRPEGEYRRRWKAAAELLRENGIKYGMLYVVHRGSLPHLGDIYRSLREENPGAGIRFNPLYRQGRAAEDSTWEDLGITAPQWGRALETLYREWVGDGRPRSVYPFAPWFRFARGGPWRLSCECSGTCVRNHFGVDPDGGVFLCGRSADGGVFLCGRSADGGDFRFGNAAELTVRELREHPVRRSLANRMTLLRRSYCRGCRWWKYCHGGCINDAVLAFGTPFRPTSFCEGLKYFFERVLEPDAAEGPEGFVRPVRLRKRRSGERKAFREVRSASLPETRELLGLPPRMTLSVPYDERVSALPPAVREKTRVRIEWGRDGDGAEVKRKLLLLSRLRFRGAVVEKLGNMNPREASSFAEFVLHEPGLNLPVEPFSSVFSALRNRKPVSLWALLGPAPPDSLSQPNSSEAGRVIDGFFFSLPRKHPTCPACPFFFFCQGYARWADACPVWRILLEKLFCAARRFGSRRPRCGKPLPGGGRSPLGAAQESQNSDRHHDSPQKGVRTRQSGWTAKGDDAQKNHQK